MPAKIGAPDSYVFFRNSQGEEVQGTLIRLSRQDTVLEVYNPYSIVQLSEVLFDMEIRRAGRVIYSGKAVVTNLVSTGLMLIVSASLVDPWSNVTNLAPGPQLRDEAELFANDWLEANSKLHPEYQLAVSNARNFLEELSRWMEHSEALLGGGVKPIQSELQAAFVQDVNRTISDKIDQLFQKFESAAREIPEPLAAIHKAFAQRELHPLMLCAPIMHRSFTKPLGYAGDFEMVNMILDNPFQGASAYAQIVNSITLRSDTAQAHRNRIDELTRLIDVEAQRVVGVGKRMQVLNIGCGPAAEVERCIQQSELSDQIDFDLVDFNVPTLEYAKARLQRTIESSGRQTGLRTMHKSVNELLKQAARRTQTAANRYDLIYCAGLFDYLADRVCGRLIQLFHEWTAPGGLIVTTNVHARHSMRGFMEHLQDWTLILRDENQMRSLAPELKHERVYTEATGANVIMCSRKVAVPQPGHAVHP